MTVTPEDVTNRKKKAEPTAAEQAAEELVRRARTRLRSCAGRISARTTGRVFTSSDGKTYRPSTFLTLTCDNTARSVRTAPRPATTISGPRATLFISRRCSTG
jgi:hypothetical protein